MHAQQMILTHPLGRGPEDDALNACVEDCYDCAQTCTSCADACLGEEMPEKLLQCIRACLDCAEVCAASGVVASRRTGSNPQLLARLLEACETACRVCAEECERHAAQMEHCRICGEECRRCERACQAARQALRATLQ